MNRASKSKVFKYEKHKGMKTFAPRKLKIADWCETVKYDASVTRHGITWYRAYKGFSERGDREDWVADLPAGCLSVSDYDWRHTSSIFKRKYKTFDAALLGEMKLFRSQLANRHREVLKEAANLVRARLLIA